jgi:hypothetical protein
MLQRSHGKALRELESFDKRFRIPSAENGTISAAIVLVAAPCSRYQEIGKKTPY